MIFAGFSKHVMQGPLDLPTDRHSPMYRWLNASKKRERDDERERERGTETETETETEPFIQMLGASK